MNVIQKIKRVFLHNSVPEVPRYPRGSLRKDQPQQLNGRWAVEEPWLGDECDWWIPFTEDDGLTELTFATKAEANSFLYARNLQDHCRVVQISRWTPPRQD